MVHAKNYETVYLRLLKLWRENWPHFSGHGVYYGKLSMA